MLRQRVVVDERDHPVLVAVMQRGEQLAPGLSGTVDEHILAVRAQPRLVAGAHHQARAADAAHRQRPVDERHRPRHVGLGKEYGSPEYQRRVADGLNECPDRLLPHEADDRPIQAEAQENGRRGGEGDNGAEQLHATGNAHPGREGIAVGNNQGHGGEHHVETQHDALFDVARNLDEPRKGRRRSLPHW